MDYTEKFTGLAKVYDKHRPTYGQWVVDNLEPINVVDMGAGTGIFTRDLLELTPFRVFAVEPNADMREELQLNLQTYIDTQRLYVVNACAEETPFEDHSIDIVTAAMSFHWFDAARFHAECKRILKPGGSLNLIYNSRPADNSMAQEMIALFKRTCPNYGGFSGGLNHALNHADTLYSRYSVLKTPRPSIFDADGWLGRNFSSSYAPKEGDPTYVDFVDGLMAIFERYSVDGKITLQNNLVVIRGQIL